MVKPDILKKIEILELYEYHAKNMQKAQIAIDKCVCKE